MEPQRTRPIYKAHCKPSRKIDQDEIFPEVLSFPPRVGNYVQSQNKRVYKITSIMHTVKVTKGKYGDLQTPRAILGLERI